jgi:hypothetical protein
MSVLAEGDALRRLPRVLVFGPVLEDVDLAARWRDLAAEAGDLRVPEEGVARLRAEAVDGCFGDLLAHLISSPAIS